MEAFSVTDDSGEKDHATEPERRLYQAVIAQAFDDATAVEPPVPDPEDWRDTRKQWYRRRGLPQSKSDIATLAAWNRYFNEYEVRVGEVRADRAQARHWLTAGDKWFRAVCEFAGLDPDRVIAKAKAMRADGWRARIEYEGVMA